ncbi:MAG TPA: hypothetical protein VGA64_10280 [Candidatus Polarisedimenticolia bacterium]
MKRLLMFGSVAALLILAASTSPASAQSVVRESTCTENYGSNTMTYDCGFNVKNYTQGSNVTLNINWSCTGNCGAATAFGLRGNGFTPGGVSGHMTGAKRLTNGLQLTFAFDQLKKTGGGAVGNAHFELDVEMDDGSGTMTSMPCNIDVHLGAQ